MKYLKKLNIIYLGNIRVSNKHILILCLLFFVSCKKTGFNIDQKLITDKQLEMDANEGGVALPGMQLGICDPLTTWKYEMVTDVAHNDYGGYMTIPYKNNLETTTYVTTAAYDDQMWLVPSNQVLDQWVGLKKKGFDTKYPDLFALATIFKVFSGHRLADTFGPIPYSEYGTSTTAKFDSEEEAYNLFFTELTNAVAALSAAEKADPNADQIRYAKFDRSSYRGDYATWIKVANTLRLRLAMRIVDINPAKAKIEAEAAVADDFGVLTTNEGSFEVTTGSLHPLFVCSMNWGDADINAALVSFLDGYNDPRLPVYAKPSSLNGTILGIRSGANKDIGSYSDFSKLNFDENPWVKLMDVSESYFLRAEGALRGWNMGGSAKDFYEEGIKTSFGENQVGGVDDYLKDNSSTPKTYTDPNNPANNGLPLTSITIQWDESASMTQKLERIITQKWIAMYPEGYEAWAEFRRTGYPKLWPVVVNNSGGEVPAGEFIKRIPYPPSVSNTSKDAMNAAISSYLNGKDGMFEPIWWDVN